MSTDQRSSPILAGLIMAGGILMAATLSVPAQPVAIRGTVGSGQDGDHERFIVRVEDTAGLGGRRPVTGGIPLPAGAAPQGAEFVLHDAAGRLVPVQTEVLARWQDGSVRWLLLDFQATPPVRGTETYTVAATAGGPRHPQPVRVGGQDGLELSTGGIKVSRSQGGLVQVAGRFDIRLTLIDGEGIRYASVMESAEVETAGPMRSTLAFRGAFRSADGRRAFGFGLRASVFAGLEKVLIEPSIVVDAEKHVVQRLRDLSLDIVPLEPLRSASIGGEPGYRGTLASPVRLFQIDDQQYRLDGVSTSGGKAPGWLQVDDGRGPVAVALKDFWQQWPKSLGVDSGAVRVGLFPAFAAGTFDHMQPWYKHQYLFDGDTYRLRTGQARRWQIWLDLAGNGAALARHAGAPLVPAADPAEAIATGVWGDIAPAGSRGMAEYDQWAESLFENGYWHSIAAERDYGAMNWGDWWGERGWNWGNHEYDTAKHVLVQFARTGDPKYFHVGDLAARHVGEVDVVHSVNEDLRRYFDKEVGGNLAYPARPGMVHQHAVGHVGGFDTIERIRELYARGTSARPYLCLDPRNLGHIWTQGMVYQYFLTGDRWMKATVTTIGENLVKLVEDRTYPFKGHNHVGRVNGWTMLAIAAAYELDFEERYLAAMKLLADDAIAEQDPHSGGWLYPLGGGHCRCQTAKHVGEAGFIGSVRLNGLSRYHELTQDPRIPDVVRRAINHKIRDTWQEQDGDWRYTSCPGSDLVGQAGVTVLAMVNSVKLTGDPEHLRILQKAWAAKFQRLRAAPPRGRGFGKTYAAGMIGCPEAMHLFVNALETQGPRAR